MEKDKNIMPEIQLFDNFKDMVIAIGSSALSYLSVLSSRSPAWDESNEILAERMMNNPEAREVYEQLRIEFDSRREQ